MSADDRPDWGRMRRQDFDAREPLTLFDRPTQPIPARPDDLLALIHPEEETP